MKYGQCIVYRSCSNFFLQLNTKAGYRFMGNDGKAAGTFN